ncbi:hypothetical protein EXS70_01390 [Candidatus Peribacteria bacterium]|nr:hypothetical protein [Candidatus Peribacteria bacterium]
MNTWLRSTGAFMGGSMLLALSVMMLQGHFQALKDIREYGLPLAAEIPPLERRNTLLGQQMELSTLEASLRTDSTSEKLHVYVLPEADDLKRPLAFLETASTFLQKRSLLRSMSEIEVGDPTDVALPDPLENLQSRTLHFSAVLRPEGRADLLSILKLSGMLTVGDILSPENIKTLFSLTETQNYAGIVPVEQFLSADVLSYAQDPTLYDQRLSQALSSEEFLKSFKSLLQASGLPHVREFLTGDLGRTLVAQKLWPVQFMTVEKESLRDRGDGWVEVDLELKAYSRGENK